MLLPIKKIGRSWYLMIPASIGIEKFKVQRSFVKEFGKFIPVPSVLKDTTIELKHGGTEVYLKKKKDYKTYFFLLKNGAIAVISVPKKVDVKYDPAINKIFFLGERVKAKVAILGDLDHPVELKDIFQAKKIKEKS